MFTSTVEVSKAVASLIVLAPYVLAGAVYAAKTALKNHFDRSLEALSAENRSHLAAIEAGHQRLVHESGLYARERHRAYARVYRKMRVATDAYAALVGLTTRPDYSKYSLERVRELLAEWKVDERDAPDLLAAYANVTTYKDRQEAGRRMGDLDHEIRRQRAERARIQFVNAEVLESLYLTDAVVAKLNDVRKHMSGFAVELEFLGEVPPKVSLSEQVIAVREAAEAVHKTMRQEFQRGDAAVALGATPSPPGSVVIASERIPNDAAQP